MFPQRRRLSVHAGLAAWPVDGETAEELLAAARPVAPGVAPGVAPAETTGAAATADAAEAA